MPFRVDTRRTRRRTRIGAPRRRFAIGFTGGTL
jgi:hypothetical protein